MNLEEFRDYCLSLPQAAEKMPFSEERYRNLVTFTIADKWFCILDLDSKSCNLKCDPERVPELQERYAGIGPAWHMNKRHWIRLELDSDLSPDEIKDLVFASYSLIVSKLPRRLRLALQ